MESNNSMTVQAYTDKLASMYNAAGITVDTSKARTARNALNKEGAVSTKLTDITAVAAAMAASSLKKSDSAIKDVCRIIGVLRMNEAWRFEVDDVGKAFKSENAFLRAILPNYQQSTVSLYADVGATIYIPAALGQLDDIPDIAELSPGNAKFLLAAVKDATKRKALPAALETAKEANGGRLSQKAIVSAVKSLNDTSAKPENVSDSAGQIANELTGGGIDKTVKALIQFDRTGDNGDGDLTAIVIERNIKDFTALMLKASQDKDTALAVCDTLYRLVKSAK